MNKSKLDYALAYAAKGWQVVPLHSQNSDGSCSCVKGQYCDRSPGKHPRTPHGLKNASTDPEVIRKWWAQWPEANIGIVTGKTSGVWAVDVDVKEGKGGDKSLANLQVLHGNLPDTVQATTPTGGKHYLFGYPEGRQIGNRVEFAQGLDSRGDNGYIVVAPSNTTVGTYQWDTGRAPV